MKTLYTKFVALTACIMVVSSLIAFVLANGYYQQKLKPENDEKNMRIAQSIAEFTSLHPDISLDEYLENLSEIGYQFYIVEDNGNERFFGSAFRDTTISKQAIDDVLAGKPYHGIRDFPQQTFVTGFFDNELSNTVGVKLSHDQHQYALFLRPDIKLLFNEMHGLFGVMFAAAILLSILFVFISTYYLVKPIRKLTRATHVIAEGKFDVPLDVTTKDEIGQLATSFSYMTAQLAKMEDVRREFISNVSHDIQSPLSSIKGYTNLLAKDTLTNEDKKVYIDVINSEIQRLSNLTQQLLQLTSIDQMQHLVKFEKVDFTALLHEMLHQHRWKIGQAGIMLRSQIEDIELEADAVMLGTIVDNLLTNATKYNRDGGSIEVIATNDGDKVRLEVKDSGIGMTDEQRQQIFKRFYRADDARTQTISGSGLGLSIVESMVQLHNGIITVDSTLHSGTIFTVLLPKKQAK